MKTCRSIKWPRHTLFEGQEAVDMRVVCARDAKTMLLKQSKTVHRRKWAAKHECEELKEGVWLDTLSDEEKCRGCNKVEGTEKHTLHHCPCWKGQSRSSEVISLFL